MHFFTLAVLDEPFQSLYSYPSHQLFYVSVYDSIASVVDQYMSFYSHDCPKYDSDTDDYDYDIDCELCDSVIGDGYVVGGRWSGLLTGYNPNFDPENLMFCQGCKGLGFISSTSSDSCEVNPCFACNIHSDFLNANDILEKPTSLRLWPRWPSDFTIYPGDITTIGKYKELFLQRDDMIPAYLISSNFKFDCDSSVWGNNVKEEFESCLDYFSPENTLVLLDVHY